MLGRQERTALFLLIGVAAVVISAHSILTVLGKHPFAQPFSSETRDGELVVVEGTIDAVAFTKTGNHVVLRVRNLTVFVPSPAAQGIEFRKGQNISAYGIAETYRGEKEVVVNSGSDIRTW